MSTTKNETEAADRAEEIADAEILEMAEADARQSLEDAYQDQFDHNVHDALDNYRSEFWQDAYDKAYKKVLHHADDEKAAMYDLARQLVITDEERERIIRWRRNQPVPPLLAALDAIKKDQEAK